MKKTIFSFITMILIISAASAQTEWIEQNSGTDRFLFDVHFVDANTGWVCGQTGTILHTSDGGANWTDLDAPPINYYSAIHFTDQSEGWVVGFGGRIQHTTDAGINWVMQNSPTQYDISDVHFANSNVGWTVGGKPRTFTDPIREILFTSNGGDSWITQYLGSNEVPLASIYFLDENTGWTVGAFSTIMKTTNGGDDWTTQMSGNGYEFEDVYFFNPDTGFVVGQDLSLQHYAVIFHTYDGGATWNLQTFGMDDSFQGVHFINESTGWVVGGNNNEAIILYTSDAGVNWTAQTVNTSNLLSAVHFSDENNGWAVGFDGTIVYNENVIPVELQSFTTKIVGSSVELIWETATETNNSGFEIQRAEQMDKFERIGFVEGNGTTTEKKKYSFIDKNLSAGNYFYRLIQIDFDGTRNESESVRAVVHGSDIKGFSLSQNYPNPFNPSTKIQFTLPQSSFVTLEIFNAIGEKVDLLISENLEAGSYNYDWNASEFPSGLYIYKLKSGNFVETKKMVLMK